MTIFSQFTAATSLTSYAVMIFEKVGTTFDPYLASILIPVALILGPLFTTYFADTLGRRKLLVCSLAGSAIGLYATALYHYLYANGTDLSSWSWVPLVSIFFVIFVASVGITPLLFLCSIEFLPPKMRTAGVTIISFGVNIASFLFVKFFFIVLEIIDLHGCMLIYGWY